MLPSWICWYLASTDAWLSFSHFSILSKLHSNALVPAFDLVDRLVQPFCYCFPAVWLFVPILKVLQRSVMYCRKLMNNFHKWNIKIYTIVFVSHFYRSLGCKENLDQVKSAAMICNKLQYVFSFCFCVTDGSQKNKLVWFLSIIADSCGWITSDGFHWPQSICNCRWQLLMNYDKWKPGLKLVVSR